MRTRWIVAAVMAVTGLVWIGQGLGVLRGSSFMVDDPRWAMAGTVSLLGGALLAWTALRNRHRT
jgi:Na+/glutamate symporter